MESSMEILKASRMEFLSRSLYGNLLWNPQ